MITKYTHKYKCVRFKWTSKPSEGTRISLIRRMRLRSKILFNWFSKGLCVICLDNV